MSIGVFKTFAAGEVLTASDLNSSFTQIVNNGTDVAFPLTKDVSAAGFKMTTLALGTLTTDAASLQNLYNLQVGVNDFRLSLMTALPVTTADVTAATTILAVPKTGNKISLYSTGTSTWATYTSAEFSLALGTITSGKPYDVFCYANAGVPTLEFLVWTNDTTRATLLAYQNGVLVKTGDASRRYLGSFYTTSTTTTEDSKANRYLFNYYHREWRPARAFINATAYTYTTFTVRQANNNTANQFNILIGVSEDQVVAEIVGDISNTNAAVIHDVGVGLDSTTANAADSVAASVGTVTLVAAQRQLVGARYAGYPGVGKHSLVWLEISAATGTSTWNSNAKHCIQGGVWA